MDATPDTEIGDRTPITGNGYAFKAAKADNASSLGGVPVSGFIQTSGGSMSGSSASQILSVTNSGGGAGLTVSSGIGRGLTATSASSTGVYGVSNAGSGNAGVQGVSAAPNGNGVIGDANNGADAYGVWGLSTSGIGVKGEASNGTNAYGVWGLNLSGTGVKGEGLGTGVLGISLGGPNGRGVEGNCYGNGCVGVIGRASGTLGSAFKYGVYGDCANTGSNCFAGYFSGRVQVVGTLTKTAGSFKIDHPLDPENKYLYHSFVESPDMMNIYNGNVVLDDRGAAWVPLPDWFEALNRDFRYQLTCIGGFAPVYVAHKISGNRFQIAGGHPGLEVSWQVTGIRRDPFAEKHRIPVEEDKPAKEKGYYLHPDAYGRPQTKSVEWIRNPEIMERMAAAEREALPKPEP